MAPKNSKEVSSATLGREALKAMRDAVTALTKAVEVLHSAVFGRWDADENKQIPGIRDRQEKLEARFDSLLKTLRVIAFIVAPAGITLLLKSLGAPTENIGHGFADAWSFIINRP